MPYFGTKPQVSLKHVREVSDAYGFPVFSCGYCALQHTLADTHVEAHNSGVYGWNWDAYVIHGSDGRGVTVITGYRNLGPKGMSLPYELARDVEYAVDESYGAYCRNDLSWEEMRFARRRAVMELADKLLKINDNRLVLDTI